MEHHFEDIRKHLLKEIDEAEFMIFCAVAWITDHQIIEALSKKSRDGVKVEVVINDDERFLKQKNEFSRFINDGGKIYLYPSVSESLMHNKFCIIDLTTTITGSYNWTNMAALKHEENIIVVKDDGKTAKGFARQFNKLKKGSVVFCLPKNNLNDSLSYARVTNIAESPVTPDIAQVCFQVDVEDGDKCSSLFFFDGPTKIPKTIYGYWMGRGDDYWGPRGSGKQYYDFVCLDPALMPYEHPGGA